MNSFKTLRLISLLTFIFITTNIKAQTEEIYYYPKLPQKDLRNIKITLARDIENFVTIEMGDPKKVVVLDDRIEFRVKNQNWIINFNDLINQSIKVVRIKKEPPADDIFRIKLKYCTLSAITGDITTGLGVDAKPDIMKDIADFLYYFQFQLNTRDYNRQLELFKPLAEQYRALNVKKLVSEEQRKYIVQANLFNEHKNYEKAIELYNKAIELDQTAYPAAYSNLALLSALTHKYGEAIFYMKKYLMLEPDATDARVAQDKIYEWEALGNQ
jgi:tetratricopeptide (TPR) repeat protein